MSLSDSITDKRRLYHKERAILVERRDSLLRQLRIAQAKLNDIEESVSRYAASDVPAHRKSDLRAAKERITDIETELDRVVSEIDLLGKQFAEDIEKMSEKMGDGSHFNMSLLSDLLHQSVANGIEMQSMANDLADIISALSEIQRIQNEHNREIKILWFHIFTPRNTQIFRAGSIILLAVGAIMWGFSDFRQPLVSSPITIALTTIITILLAVSFWFLRDKAKRTIVDALRKKGVINGR